ncbi:MAG: phosphate signaling complex protein PhoU [Chloroflexota bacterium]
MGSMVEKSLSRVMSALTTTNGLLAQEVVDGDDAIDRQRYRIEHSCLMLIATQQPLASDLRTVTGILSIATDLERMGDHIEGIAHLSQRLAGEFPVKAPPGLATMADSVVALLRAALDTFLRRDAAGAYAILRADDEVDGHYNANLRVLLTYMIEDPRAIPGATYLLWVDHNLERLGDRVTNIAERTIFMVTGSPPTPWEGPADQEADRR